MPLHISREEISQLVDTFYARVREDEVIGPVFNENVKSWPAHLSLLKDFWASILLSEGSYKGNPLVAHFNLPMKERFFVRWLQLFGETAQDIFPEYEAELILGKARNIAGNMRRVFAAQNAA
ncbi:MAG: group III truncated hemoglobin [Acidobacteriaceae bacterium]